MYIKMKMNLFPIRRGWPPGHPVKERCSMCGTSWMPSPTMFLYKFSIYVGNDTPTK